jgi:hypothetical protein
LGTAELPLVIKGLISILGLDFIKPVRKISSSEKSVLRKTPPEWTFKVSGAFEVSRF